MPEFDRNLANRSITPETAGNIPSESPRSRAARTSSGFSVSRTQSPGWTFVPTLNTSTPPTKVPVSKLWYYMDTFLFVTRPTDTPAKTNAPDHETSQMDGAARDILLWS